MVQELKAIIIGGGIGGFAAAAAAIKHFDKVMLIERDDILNYRIDDESILETRKRRPGVPQYTEPHVLLAGGSRALNTLVPGFTQELVRRGAQEYDAGIGLKSFDFGARYMPASTPGVYIYGASRRLINEVLQELVMKQAQGQQKQDQTSEKLQILDGTTVTDLLWRGSASADAAPKSMLSSGTTKKQVVGVVLDSNEHLYADLIIVCNGRRTMLPKWLEKAGINVPPQVKVDCGTTYAARWMQLPSDFDPDKEFYSIVINGRPTMARGGIGLVLENGLCQISLTGFEGERAPLDHDGWMAYARSLPDKTCYELAQRCQPIGPITRFASTPNVSRQYHTISKREFPENLIIMADACACVNPVYGQGQSIAARSAVVLDSVLTKGFKRHKDPRHFLQTFGPNFQRRLKKEMDVAWNMSCGEDFRWPNVVVEGVQRPPKFLYTYLDAIFVACQEDSKVWTRMLKIAQFVEEPTALFAPRMVFKALKYIITGKTKKIYVKKSKSLEQGKIIDENNSPIEDAPMALAVV